MNILFTYVRKYLLKNKISTFISIFSISCASALFFVVLSLGINTLNGINDTTINLYGNYHALYTNVSNDFVTSLDLHAKVDKINLVEFQKELNNQDYQANINSFYILGLSEDTFYDLGLQLIEGRFPRNQYEIIVSDYFISNSKVLIDIDTIMNLNNQEYTIVGIVSHLFFEDNSDYYSLLTINNNEGIKNAYIRYNNPNEIQRYTEQISSSFIKEYEHAYINNHVFLYNITDNNSSIIMIILFIGFITFLFMNILLLVNCYKNSYANREKHLAILKTIGVTQSQCKTMILYEGMVLLFISLIIGLFTGWNVYDYLVSVINSLLLNISVDIFQITSEFKIYILIVTILYVTLISMVSMKISTDKIISQTVTITFQSNDEVLALNEPYLELGKEKNIMLRILNKNIRQNKKIYSPLVIGITLIASIFIFINSLMGYLREDLLVNSYEQNYDVEVVIQNQSYPTSLMTQLKNLENDSHVVISEKIVLQTNQVDAFNEEFLDLIIYDDLISIDILTFSDSVLSDFTNYVKLNEEVIFNTKQPSAILIDETYSLSKRRYYNILNENIDLNLFYNGQSIINSLDIYTTDVLITGTEYQKNPQILVSRELFNKIYDKLNIDNHEYHVYYQSNDTKSLIKELNLLNYEQINEVSIQNTRADINSGKIISTLIRIISYGYVVLLALMALLTMSCITSINFDYRKKEFLLYRLVGLRFVEMMQLIFMELGYYLIRIFAYSWIIALLLNVLVYQIYFYKLGLRFFIPSNSILGSIIVFIVVHVIFMNYIYLRMKKQKYSEVLKNEISLM